MDRVLIVSTSEKPRKYIAEFLIAHGISAPADTATSGSEARRVMLRQNFDLVIINAPLQDEFGHALASDFSGKTQAGVLLVAKADLYDQVCAKVEDAGVLVVSKPINRLFFYQCIRTAVATSRRLVALEAENRKLQNKIHETQLIGRAKCALVQYRHLTEEEAHHFIEKQAMDQRVPKREVAEDILQTYEDV